MKAIKCSLVINTSYGYICAPLHFNSVSEAIRYAHGGNGGFAFRIFDETGKFIRRGFCC